MARFRPALVFIPCGVKTAGLDKGTSGWQIAWNGSNIQIAEKRPAPARIKNWDGK